MELARLDGTVTVLRNLIHMAPCTTKTSDNKETACQENKNSSLFHLIIATGTHFGTQAGYYWVDGEHCTVLIHLQSCQMICGLQYRPSSYA